MATKSKIEWTESMWNPVTGCTKISDGCKNCYAEKLAKRLQAMGQANYKNGFKLTLQPKMLEIPLSWKKSRTIFVNSMSDLFHRDVPLDYIQQVFNVMAKADWHNFQVLTKRSERLKELSRELNWKPHIWMGVSVENEKVMHRIDDLRKTDAYIKFLSIEPLLGRLPKLDLTGIDWVIVGGESGPNARPMQPDWARSIRDQCKAAGIPFFFKQWGEWIPYEDDAQQPFFNSQHGDRMFDGHHFPPEISGSEPCRDRDGSIWWWPEIEGPVYRRVGTKAAGRTLDGRTYDEMPVT